MAVQYLNVFLGFVELFMFKWKGIFYFLLQLSQPAFQFLGLLFTAVPTLLKEAQRSYKRLRHFIMTYCTIWICYKIASSTH